ncbi:ATP-binding protein [Robbsia sp. Bb-Pol-6]|uniref:histidine kinase n=1 Tax=Robbsia betulipollinis TaxID=2981849 RepID=A0ABT3ZM50_9BURK|nr:ATP-binding protein [Robbsia betulipollinis]MCY0387623.1 ATP-binding protein [Robbsia betulipollinis]
MRYLLRPERGASYRGWFRLVPGVVAVPLLCALYLSNDALVSHAWLTRLLVLWTASSLLIGLVEVWHMARDGRQRTSPKRVYETLAAAHDAARDAVLATNVIGAIVYLNASAERLIGVTAANALGEPLDAVLNLHLASGGRIDPLDCRQADGVSPCGDVPLAAFAFLRATDRTTRPIQLSVLPLLSETRRVEGALLFVRDGARAHRAAQNDAYARQVTHATLDAVIDIDADLTICRWNKGATQLFSYHEDEVTGESLAMLVTADRKQALEQTVRAALAGECFSDRDLTIRTRDGRECDVSLTAFRIEVAAGAHRHAVLVLRNIHERRIGERRVRHLGAQLVRRAQELQAIFDIAPVGMAIADSPDCLHVRPNLALARMLGVERSAEVTLDHAATYSLWHDGQPMQAYESPLHAAVAQRAAITPLEIEIRTADTSATVMAYSAPVIDQDNAVVGAIAVFVDISAMKHVHAERQQLLAEAIAARRAAEDASRLKEEFLATVSHELRTPLNAMHGWLEIMQRKPDAQTQARGLDVIRRNVRAQTRVIEDILDVSAFVTGKVRLVVRPIDLLDVVRVVVESLRPTADAKAIHLLLTDERIPAGGEAPVNGDPERLQQVIWNLLSNAVKFTPSGGRVRVGLSRAAQHFVVSVADTGEGIDGAFLPYVFDRFRQADSSIERRHAGLGLGLAIVRHMVELHGGSVSVESAGLGKGATFAIQLPVRVASEGPPDTVGASTADATGTATARKPLAGRDILIVEDDASAADMLAHALDDEGASVRVAHSAAVALALIAARGPDAVVSDIGLPERDGYAFIGDVRAAERGVAGTRLYAIAVTAYARPEDRDHALAAGFDAYLVKPVAPSSVTQLLAAHFAKGI